MPIKIPDKLPAREVLENENIFVMTEKRARTQDMRPLRILPCEILVRIPYGCPLAESNICQIGMVTELDRIREPLLDSSRIDPVEDVQILCAVVPWRIAKQGALPFRRKRIAETLEFTYLCHFNISYFPRAFESEAMVLLFSSGSPNVILAHVGSPCEASGLMMTPSRSIALNTSSLSAPRSTQMKFDSDG